MRPHQSVTYSVIFHYEIQLFKTTVSENMNRSGFFLFCHTFI